MAPSKRFPLLCPPSSALSPLASLLLPSCFFPLSHQTCRCVLLSSPSSHWPQVQLRLLSYVSSLSNKREKQHCSPLARQEIDFSDFATSGTSDAETWLNQQGLTIADWSVDERYVFSSCLPAVPPADLTKLTPPSFLTVPSPSSTPSPTLISPTGLSASRQADQTTAPNLTERKCKRLTSQSSTERSRRSRN
jgi:hypothetical protein